MAKTTATNDDLMSVAQKCIDIAKKKGAREASARATRVRDVSMEWRDGNPEKIQESTTRGVSLELYVDGRYSMANTSDLRPEALETFIGDSITLAKTLAADPFRALPDPELHKNLPKVDLQLEDAAYTSVTPDQRKKIAKELEAASRGVKGSEAILSVTTGFNDTLAETYLVNSNGFSGVRRGTSFFISSQVSVKDKDGRRPEEYAYAGARHLAELPSAAVIGREAGERTMSRLGAKKSESAVLPMLVENRSAGRLVGAFGQALSGNALQQKRSFLEGKVGQQVMSEIVTISDDPLIPRAFGSRQFDNEGIVARQLAMIEKGILRNYYLDTYYSRKLKMSPTTAGTSNLNWTLGAKSKAELIKEIKDGILVTGFIGGNSNSLTGDFSLGVNGFRIRDGAIAEAVSEMNISGNHLEFWKKLAAVGNDPFPYSFLRTPTLLFEGVSFAGV
jgi:PmbA protein